MKNNKRTEASEVPKIKKSKSFKKRYREFKKSLINFSFDHVRLMDALSITKSFLMASLGAIIFAIGYVAFILPAKFDPTTLEGSSITTGGVSGISQVINLVFKICGSKVDLTDVISYSYLIINIPICLFGFFKVGKRFSVISFLNVILSSLMIQVFTKNTDFFVNLAKQLEGQQLSRVVFAAVFVGISSAVAYKGDASCGGIDVISYYFAIKKSTGVGKYTSSFNACIIGTYFILTIVYNKQQGNAGHVDVATLNTLYSIAYVFIASLVIDLINTRNKKVQVQIISENKDIGAILVANFPHSNTTLTGIGGFSHKERAVVIMTVSSVEVKRVIATAKKADSTCFCTVTPLIQAYGNFYIKPIQ